MKFKNTLIILSTTILCFSCSLSKKDTMTANKNLHDIWVVTKINGQPINKMISVPQLEINLTENRILGTDGCNRFSATIQKVTDNEFVFGPMASTKKMCFKPGVEKEFNNAMSKVSNYKVAQLQLLLTDANGKEVLSLLKAD